MLVRQSRKRAVSPHAVQQCAADVQMCIFAAVLFLARCVSLSRGCDWRGLMGVGVLALGWLVLRFRLGIVVFALVGVVGECKGAQRAGGG
ncbi:hypothetical protein BU24DRAFT_123385 [Aaosphaeria arxii CBS 175.79]|uniref:Uncharacterized protein n=1 Tax=Aaosphaeria arxii CBS 175.79 TaxID=1450172 RepID=A0A6A5Y501_9PLEO|nr:uncharacterized protein BU24DRAFT_123385 [Aaosphaeria arxii CBS 175.79]KAF2019604.1 hypothetical protein BU24DRAFT_123385 [Aaosphaeria arxii CBS 175.79]